MPTIQDEEESLCLLASDLQNSHERSAQEMMLEDDDKNWPKKSNSDKTDQDWMEVDPDQASFLSQGTAEKAFFNVCKTHEESENEEFFENDDGVEVMNDIIGALEADHELALKTKNDKLGKNGKLNELESRETRNSRSLVVDIHLPPTSEDLEDSDTNSTHQIQNQNQNTSGSSRPCKHEVNRFQRCYSDGSQASPKKKAKVGVNLLNGFFLSNV